MKAKQARLLHFCPAEALPETGVFGRDLNMLDYRRYLGRSMEALYWDARAGFYPNAFAALLPCVAAGGAVWLHLPEHYPQGDPDHLRFLDWGVPVDLCQPRFQQRLRRLAWQEALPTPPAEALLSPIHYPCLFWGKRGRGKSHHLRQLAAQAQEALWVAPFRPSFPVARFLPPDEALRRRPPADLLCIDEAASLAPHQLLALTAHYPRYALAGTNDGYEGQGRHFAIHIIPQLKQRDHLNIIELTQPWRYPADALEDWAERAFCSAFAAQEALPPLHIRRWREEDWANEALLQSLMALLHQAHYRTRPDDVKRFMDLPHQEFYMAYQEDSVTAVLHAVYESALPQTLAAAVCARQRRPRGRLALQQALWQSQDIDFNRDLWRISRIAVHHDFRRQGWGRRLIEALRAEVDTPLAVSYAHQEGLQAFWRRLGFQEYTRSARHHVLAYSPPIVT